MLYSDGMLKCKIRLLLLFLTVVWGNPDIRGLDIRNFRGGNGDRIMVNLNGHEVGNGGYSQEEPKNYYAIALLNNLHAAFDEAGAETC